MKFIILPIILALSACSQTQPLVKPALPVPAVFPAAAGSASGTPAAQLGWRAMFGDPRLQRLIELALINNRDLRLAALNVEAAQAEYGIQRSEQLPKIDAAAGAARQRAPANGATAAITQTQYSVNVAMSAFEIDLFGRLRALSDAALARYLASEQGRRAAQISLVGAVADAYFAERLADEQKRLAERTLADWRQSLDLARRLRAGLQNSGLDVAQAESQVASAEADLEARARAAAQAGNALQLLLGAAPPDDLPAPLPLASQAVATRLPAGLPSDLLLRRPDILQAEQALAAANADIGAARAAFYPTLSLTASLGFASPAMRGLFSGAHRAWSFAPQLSVPLFPDDRLRAELRLAELRELGAVAEYERAIQTAFREVADALAGRETFSRQIAAQERAAASAERRAELSAQRYRAGLDGRLELLDSQRQLYAAQQALLDLRRGEYANAVALYKALGGGLIDS